MSKSTHVPVHANPNQGGTTMSKSTHEPVHANPNQGATVMTSTIRTKKTANPNQGGTTMPSTTPKKKTTSPVTSPPSIITTSAAPSSPALTGTTTVTGASPGTTRGKAQVINGLVALLGALSANYATSDTFELPSGTYTLPELFQAFNAYITAVSDVGSASLAFHVTVEKEESLRASTLSLRSELKAFIAARIGKSATGMTAYGFEPAKTATVSPKARVAGAVKAEATRTARGTMSAKQKAEITGNVTSVLITPVMQGAAQASAPANTPVALAPVAIPIPKS
jgi:hypothetical protein